MFKLIFHPEVLKEVSSLEESLQAKVITSFEKLKTQGNSLRFPHSSQIKEGLFELRVGKKNIARVFFAFEINKTIYVLRAFVKKTQRTPNLEINLALTRLKELKNEN